MRIKNLKNGLEGQVQDIKLWQDVIQKTADHYDRIYFCRLKNRACSTTQYKSCVYMEMYQVIEDKEIKKKRKGGKK